ncbi:MAG: DNA polymerase I, partial [Erysipelotrichaceae bacterium]|nr:DNA polymerase I [Erysipelotrichaceae bacterium]
DAVGICWIEKEGIEADDIIGTTVKRYPDWDINILSSDRDLLQLIDATSSVWLMKKGLTEIVEMTEESLYEELKIKPLQITDLKGLMGDASDNIPGVPKVGEKTALKLLYDYGTVENLLDHTSELKGKLKENIESNADLARLSKLLATINTQCEFPLDINECDVRTDNQKAIEFFTKYDMRVFLSKYRTKAEPEKVMEYRQVKKVPDGYFSMPTVVIPDQNDKRAQDAVLYGFAFANGTGILYQELEDAKRDNKTMEFLTSDREKIVVSSKDFYHVAGKEMKVQPEGVFDCLVAHFLTAGKGSDLQGLLDSCRTSLPYTFEEVYGKPNKPILPEPDKQMKLTCSVAEFILNHYEKWKKDLNRYDMNSLYYEMELPLTHVLYEMETEGIRVDIGILDQIAGKTKQQIDNLSEKIYELCGKVFNINSPKQLAEVLYDDLGLPGGKKRSTAADVLEKLSGHEVVRNILEYRKYQKLYSTYAEGLKKYITPDGKIHTSYNQCVTQTGRLSSTEPNLQNISVRSEEGREIRKAFIPEENCVLMSADYSQIELRILAHMANEKALIDAFNNDQDIHTRTAMDVFHVTADEVTSLMRRQAKAVNFGIVYGISDFGLAEQLQISRKEAGVYIDRYFESYPRIKGFMDDVVSYCEQNGYVTTLCNRRREIPEIHDKNYMMREFGKRAAMNAPIQGSAADLIKIAMIHIARKMKEMNVKSKMILQVHDELIFNVPEDERQLMSDLIETEMANAMNIQVPLIARCVEGATWYEAK